MKVSIILACSSLLFLFSCSQNHHEKKEDATYVATTLVKRDTIIFHDYVGQIHSIQHIELRALEKGYLQDIYVDEGEFVKKGQLLFQIFPVIYRAEMQKTQAEANFAEIEYLNTKSLADSNIVSRNELALARAKYEKAKAELQLAQAHLGFTEIRAPFDGIVGRFNDVRVGSMLEEGELLTTLSDNSKMWVYFNVPEAEYLNISRHPLEESKIKVKLILANNEVYNEQGIVETIEADFNNETGNIAFRATFANPTGILRNGETGNIQVPVYLKNAILIPQQSTYEVLDKKFVFVLDGNNVAHSTEIKIGSEMPHLYQVLKGLNQDDKILAEGIRKVKNGEHVEYKIIPLNKLLNNLNRLHAE